MPRTRSLHVVWRHFLQAHALLTKRVDSALLEAGCISFDTYDVLITLAEATDRRLRMSELADATFFSNSGISRRVARLEKDGFLRREGCSRDGRVFFAVLTAKGAGALRKAWPVYERVVEEDFGEAMKAGEVRDLGRILKTMVNRFGGAVSDRTDEPPV